MLNSKRFFILVTIICMIAVSLVYAATSRRANAGSTEFITRRGITISVPVMAGPNRILGRVTQEADTVKLIEFEAVGVDSVKVKRSVLPNGLTVSASGKKITIRGDANGKPLGVQSIGTITFEGAVIPMEGWNGPPITKLSTVDLIWHIHPGGDSDFIPTLGDTVMSQNP